MNSVLTPDEFAKVLETYTLKCIGQHSDMYAIKERLIQSYRYLYQQLPSVDLHARPHAALIKAWADGATIECWYPTEQLWVEREIPNWLPEFEYRIKGDDHGS